MPLRRAAPQAGDVPADSAGFRLRGLETTRLETFVDAAFAFAVTLLVISIDAVPTSVSQLLLVLEDVPAFALSFLQLALFWYAHWTWSRRYGLEDFTSVVLSLALVFVVLVYVYPLRVMFSLLVAWISGGELGRAALQDFSELNLVFLIYGIGFCLMSLVIALLYHHALRTADALELDDLEVLETRGEREVMLILATVGAASLLLAVMVPPGPLALPGWIYMAIPVATGFHAKLFGRRRARVMAAGAAPAEQERTAAGGVERD